VCREADILVAAVGQPFLVGAGHVKDDAVVVDVGMNRVTDGALDERHVRDPRRLASFRERGSLLVGDVDFEAVAEVAEKITPVPGGVGPLTRVMLLVNTLTAARRLES
jgi:methylenetetrahydrofolate dehydrogenase (NADP+)/methenyltetrahydrofolate cyclohydrolase